MNTTSKQLLKTLFCDITSHPQDVRVDWKQLTTNEIQTLYQTKIENNTFSPFPKSEWCIPELKTYDGTQCTCVFPKGQTAIITFIHNHEPQRKIQNALSKMISWLFFVCSHSHPQCSEKMNVYLFLSTCKKRLPNTPRTPLQTIHVNSAFTTSCKPSTEIILYRQEEWFKVFLHETFHCFGLDFSGMHGVEDETNTKILELFSGADKQTDVRLYESYCEVWAELINLLYCTGCVGMGKGNWSKMDIAWKKEVEHSLAQVRKICKHYGMSYNQLIHSNTVVYVEKTNVLSYYFIKTGLMLNINAFLEWCKTHSLHPRFSIQFRQTNETVRSYVELVKLCYTHPKLLRLFSVASRKTRKQNGKEYMHLRMTRKDCE